jgi:hypothetical protein
VGLVKDSDNQPNRQKGNLDESEQQNRYERVLMHGGGFELILQ